MDIKFTLCFTLLFVTAIMAVPVPQKKFTVLQPKPLQPIPTAVLAPPKSPSAPAHELPTYEITETHAEEFHEEELPELETMSPIELSPEHVMEACKVGDKACIARNNHH